MLYREGTLSVQAIAEQLNIAKSTLYVYLRHRGVPISPYQQHPPPTSGPGSQHMRRLRSGEESPSRQTAMGSHPVDAVPHHGARRRRA
jgi:hypothetical protein